MKFNSYIRTKVFFGTGCLYENKTALKEVGKRCFIVTGKVSGRVSGALDDLIKVLCELDIEYCIFDTMSNNPSLEDISVASKEATKWKSDFIAGVGGGSPLDASKAVAVLAINNIEAIDLYKNTYEKRPLPIVAIPTTAGTGSEVTPYSILSRDDLKTKMSFGNEDTYPVISYIDPKYTMSTSYNITVNTALDAFTHALEGYLSKRSTPYSDIFALEAIKLFGECIPKLREKELSLGLREQLMYFSMLSGMTIAHTGTTIMHGLGYNLTYFYQVPHGLANIYFLKEYLKFNYSESQEKIDKVLSLLGFSSIEEFMGVVNAMVSKDIEISKEELNCFAEITMMQKSTLQNIRAVTKDDLSKIIEKSLAIKKEEV